MKPWNTEIYVLKCKKVVAKSTVQIKFAYMYSRCMAVFSFVFLRPALLSVYHCWSKFACAMKSSSLLEVGGCLC